MIHSPSWCKRCDLLRGHWWWIPTVPTKSFKKEKKREDGKGNFDFFFGEVPEAKSVFKKNNFSMPLGFHSNMPDRVPWSSILESDWVWKQADPTLSSVLLDWVGIWPKKSAVLDQQEAAENPDTNRNPIKEKSIRGNSISFPLTSR